uniref:14_3_3 domain-containing protein n=1 Tax=Steinernema glaseri TaxID=37863 RepID=A0A1I7YEL7_9BILA
MALPEGEDPPTPPPPTWSISTTELPRSSGITFAMVRQHFLDAERLFTSSFGQFLDVPVYTMVLLGSAIDLEETILNSGRETVVKEENIANQEFGSTQIVKGIYYACSNVVRNKREDPRFSTAIDDKFKQIVMAFYARSVAELCILYADPADGTDKQDGQGEGEGEQGEGEQGDLSEQG